MFACFSFFHREKRHLMQSKMKISLSNYMIASLCWRIRTRLVFVCMFVRVCACLSACVRTRVCACVRACVRTRARACVCAKGLELINLSALPNQSTRKVNFSPSHRSHSLQRYSQMLHSHSTRLRKSPQPFLPRARVYALADLWVNKIR